MKVGSVYLNSYYYKNSVHVNTPEQAEQCDVLVFWGGNDINPQIYGQKSVLAQTPHGMRDSIEFEIMREFLGKKPILGVCRGAQLACAMLGGSLYQHVTGHQGDHDMVIKPKFRQFADEQAIIPTTSVHHQMMILPESCELIAFSPGQSKTRCVYDPKEERGYYKEEGVHDDPEVAVDVENKVLLVQGHPEYEPRGRIFTEFTAKLMKHFFGVDL